MVEAIKKSQADPLAAAYSLHANGKQPIPALSAAQTNTAKAVKPNVICPQARPGAGSPIVPNVTCCSIDCTPGPTPGPSHAPTPTPQPRPFSGLKVAHDPQGQISSYALPSGGTYNQFGYDAEGSVTDYYGFGGVPGDTAHPAKHVNNQYNVRGEVTGQHVFDGAATTSYSGDWPSFAVFPANGTMTPYRDQSIDSGWQNLNGLIDNWNTFSGKWTQQTQNISYNTAAGACKRVGSQFTWSQDASGRDVGIHVAQIQSFPPDCSNPAYMGGDVTRLYDFDDRLVQWRFASGNFWPGASEGLQCAPPTNNGLPSLTQGYMGTRNYGWGPEEKLVQTSDGGGTHALHWDGDELLFVTNGQGGIEDLKLGSDASVAHGKLIVIDRDWAGVTVQGHDASGYGPWVPLSPFQQACTPNSPPPASPGFDNPGGVTFVQRGLDGYYDGLNVFQGVRTYDPQTTQWTTPDAYAGEINDPMSQKPYMWNRNDSFRYTDPSGYCVGPAVALAPLCFIALKMVSAVAQHGPAITSELAAPGSGAGAGVAERLAMNAARGALAEATVRQATGWEKFSVTTLSGRLRMIDGFDPVSGRLNEIKVGRVGTDGRIMQEASKDAELVRQGFKVTWHFFDSSLTGLGGPTEGLRAYLSGAGIQIEQHHIAF